MNKDVDASSLPSEDGERSMQWWITKKDSMGGPHARVPDLATLGLLWPSCELPQSYLECPGGRCDGQRAATRADAIDGR